MSLRVIGFGPSRRVKTVTATWVPDNRNALTKIQFPVLGFPRQQTRKALHLVPADLVVIDVVVVAVAEGPQVVRLVLPLGLAESVRG